ncbi:MAG: lipopolysaccharide biosynthesis protein [Candidatus Moraniibacteriota bacterium]
MIAIIKTRLTNFTEMLHLRIFGHEMGEEMRKFLSHLSWSFFGGIIASILMLGVNIGMGRYFGPEEYGKYNFVLILSQFLLIFVYLGTDVSSIKFLSGEKESSEKKAFFSSSFYFVLFMILLLWIAYGFAYSKIEHYFNVDSQYVFLALIFGSVLGVKGIVDGYLRAYSLFRFQAILRVIEAITIIAFLFLILKMIGIKEYQYYVYAVAGGAVLFSLVTLFRLRENFGVFQWSSLKLMLSYGNVILIGTIFGTTFNSLDKIIVAKYLGVAQLGIYSAYFMTSTNLIAQMTQVFNNVFFPTISQVADTAYVAKINTLIKWFFVPGGIILSLVLYGVLLVFGKAYKPDMLLAVGFGFLSILQILLTINASMITALSKELLKKYYFWLYGVSFFHMAVYGIFIYFKSITIPILLLLFFVNFSIMILIQKNLIYSFIKAKNG